MFALCTDVRSTSSLEILSNRTIQVPAADATVTEKAIHTLGSFNSTMTIEVLSTVIGEILATANVTDTSNPFMLTTGVLSLSMHALIFVL